MLDQHRVDFSQSLHRVIDMIDDWLVRVIGLTQYFDRQFDDLKRRIHEVANVQKRVGQTLDSETLRLNLSNFLLELCSPESINERKYACQGEGEQRPGLGIRHLCSYLAWGRRSRIAKRR